MTRAAAAGPEKGPAAPFWIASAALAASYYWLLAGSVTFQGLASRLLSSVAPGAAGGSFELLGLPLHAAPALWLFWISGALGRSAASRWLVLIEEASARVLVAILAGFAVLTYSFWFLGLAGLFSRPALWIACAVLTAAAAPGSRAFLGDLSRSAQDMAGGLRSASGSWDAWGRMAAAAALVFFIIQLPAAHAPTIDRDDLSYQLYIPAAYLDAGGIVEPPFPQRQSFFHQIINMSYVPLLFLGGETAAVFANVFWSLVLLLTAYALARKAAPAGPAASLAAISVWALPARTYLAQTASTDIAAVSYSLGGLWCLLAWKDSGRAGLLGLSAFLSAFALNKYTSLGYFIPTALAFMWLSRRSLKEAARGLALYAAFAALCLAPLGIWLYATKGNPVYPLYFFGLPFDQIEAAVHQGWIESRNWATARGMLLGSLPYMGPWVVMAAALIAAPRLLPGANGLLLAWLAVSLAFKFATQGAAGLMPRYILGCLAAAICVTHAAWQAAAATPPLKAAVRLFTLAAWIAPCAVTAAAVSRPQWALNLGRLSREEFLERFYPSEGWDMARRVNALPAEARVAVLDHHFMPYHYKDAGARLLPLAYEDLRLSEPREIREALRERGATHVLWVRSQWHVQPSPLGALMRGILFARPLECRWWTQSPVLAFLRPLHETPGAVLFEVAP